LNTGIKLQKACPESKDISRVGQ